MEPPSVLMALPLVPAQEAAADAGQGVCKCVDAAAARRQLHAILALDLGEPLWGALLLLHS